MNHQDDVSQWIICILSTISRTICILMFDNFCDFQWLKLNWAISSPTMSLKLPLLLLPRKCLCQSTQMEIGNEPAVLNRMDERERD